MKRLIVILGANGIGKSTVSKVLLQKLARSAYIDAEWCRTINPFEFTAATKLTVINNIYGLMKNYFLCADVDTIIFPYGFHGGRKDIFDIVMKQLRHEQIEFEIFPVVLTCKLNEHVRRMKKDSRDNGRIQRAIDNTRKLYESYEYPKIDTTYLSVEETTDRIIMMLK